MRSATPKLAHDLCGRPLLAWPLAAARDAGASRIVVVVGADDGRHARGVARRAERRAGGPARAARHGGRGRRRGGADRRATACRSCSPATCRSSRRSCCASSRDAHARGGAAATMVTAVLDDPRGYGRVVRGDAWRVERVVETKVAGDASDSASSRSRGQHRDLRLRRWRAARRARRGRRGQRAGRALPARGAGAAARAAARASRRSRPRRPGGRARRQRPRRPRGGDAPRRSGGSTSATCSPG